MINNIFTFENEELKNKFKHDLEKITISFSFFLYELPMIYFQKENSNAENIILFQNNIEHLIYVSDNYLFYNNLKNFYFKKDQAGLLSILHYIRIEYLSINNRFVNIQRLNEKINLAIYSNSDFYDLLNLVSAFFKSTYIVFKKNKEILYIDKGYSKDIEQIESLLSEFKRFNFDMQKAFFIDFNMIHRFSSSFFIDSDIHNMWIFKINTEINILLINTITQDLTNKEIQQLNLIFNLIYNKIESAKQGKAAIANKEKIENLLSDLPVGIFIQDEKNEQNCFVNKKYNNTPLENLKILQYSLALNDDTNYKLKIGLDLSESKRLEAQLNTDYNEFNDIFTSFPLPVCIIDEAYEIIQYNTNFEILFNHIFLDFNRFVFMKKGVFTVFKSWKKHLRTAFEDEFSESVDNVSISGNPYSFHTKFHQVYSQSNSKKIMIIMTDLSEYKSVTNKANLIEKQYMALIKLLPMGFVIILDSDLKILIATGSELKKIFYDKKTINNTNLLNYFDDKTRCFFREHFGKASELGESSAEWQFKKHWFEISSKIIDNNELGKKMFITVFYNISDKKALLTKISESEKKLNAFYQNSAIGMFRISADGKVLKCNPAFCNMLKIPFDHPVHNINIFKDIHFKTTDLTQKTKDFNRIYQTFSEQKIFVLENLRPVFDTDKNILYFEGTVVNMTEIVITRLKLKEREQKYKLLAENQHDAIMTFNNDLELTYCSKAIEKILIFDVEHFYQADIFSILPNNSKLFLKKFSKDELLTYCKSLCRDNFYSFDTILLDKNAQEQNVEITISVLEDDVNESLGFLFVIKDINEKKKIQRKLAISESKYHSIFDLSPIGIVIINSSGYIIDVNNSVKKLLGKNKNSDFINKRVSEFNILKNDIKKIMKMLKKDNKIASYQLNYNTNLKNTKILNISCSSFDVYNDKYYFILVEDITNDVKYKSFIESSLKEKEVLLQEIHHRVKNNLQIVCSLLYLEADKTKSKKTLKALEDSYHRIRSMAIIHEKLYNEKNFSHVNMNSYIRDISGFLIKSLKPSDFNLNLEIRVKDLFLSVNQAIPCALIINELLSNSIKYAFNLNNNDAKITVSLTQDGEELILDVSDNGKTEKEKGFDPFKKKNLGLHLVKTLTTQLQGRLKWNYHKGLCIQIVFPFNPYMEKEEENYEKENFDY